MRKSAVFTAIFFLLGISAARADQIFVDAATGSGVPASDLDTATTLVRSSVTEVSSNTVVDGPGNADYILHPNLVRLGKAYILSVSKVKNGQTVFTSHLKAANIEELDKVAQRVTASVLSGKRAASDAHIGEITDQEARDGTQRKPTRRVVYLGIGGSDLSNLNAQHLGYSLGAAIGWDTNRFLLKVMGELDGAGDALMLSGGLGLNYFILTSDFAPYVGVDFGYGVAKADGGSLFDGSSRGGFILGAGTGFEVLRTSNVNLEIGFRFGILMNSNSYGYPEVFSLRAGVYF